MCGIVGYIGTNVKRNLIQSLKKLEYRGYDSAGISWVDNNSIYIIKRKGYINNLEKQINYNLNFNTVGIAHTRWATHGEANNKNAHPHYSNSKEFSLVHNGIIENYSEIKSFLKENNYYFLSDTDSEVIVNLIEYFYNIGHDVLRALNLTCKKLKGSYSISLLHNTEQKIYFAKYNMPLYVDAENFFVASDVNAFIKKSSKIYSVENLEYGYISLNGIKFFKQGKEITKKALKIESVTEQNSKNGYEHFMLKEINEIDNAIKNTILSYKSSKKLEKIIQNIDKVYLIACGTAYHACLNGEKFLIKYAKINAFSFIASEFFLSPPIIDKNTLCVFISQSGETADTINSLKLAKKKHAKTLVITNVKTSSIARLANINYFTEAGPEIAVASTKAYNTQVAILYKIVVDICKIKGTNIKELTIHDNLKIKEINEKVEVFKTIAESVLKYDKVYYLGRNLDYVQAQEGSLKLKEITYINCQAISAGELKHGTLSLIDNDSLVIDILTEKDKLDKNINNINEILSRNGNVLFISPFKEEIENKLKHKMTDNFIELPKIYNAFYPLITSIPLFYLAYFVSIRKGINPDKPRNLAKSVTVE